MYQILLIQRYNEIFNQEKKYLLSSYREIDTITQEAKNKFIEFQGFYGKRMK